MVVLVINQATTCNSTSKWYRCHYESHDDWVCEDYSPISQLPSISSPAWLKGQQDVSVNTISCWPQILETLIIYLDHFSTGNTIWSAFSRTLCSLCIHEMHKYFVVSSHESLSTWPRFSVLLKSFSLANIVSWIWRKARGWRKWCNFVLMSPKSFGFRAKCYYLYICNLFSEL